MPSEIVADAIDLRGAGGNGGGGLPPGSREDGGNGSFGPGAVPQRTYMTGMLIALGGILMFFAALVSALVVRKGLSAVAWETIEVPRILWLNTLILLASSATLVRSRRDFLARDDAGFRHWWGVTTILGLFFVVGQILAWHQLVSAGVYLDTNASSSFFYIFTAAHGLHLLGGIAAMLAVAFRRGRHLTRGTAMEVVSIYWHFVDALWLCLFALLLVQDRL
ncbi:MAG TPA: heme-copper oxidase subunit III [Candidatus Acidoferrales bacterium]|jgi:cytochrome c oxidase subunit 3|nr:heme-copper oxidase subunit III [Candidatus Acidoferrales bacterium]